jgi:hypothetical protein
MRLQPSRGSFTVLATFLVLAISFDSSPILPSIPKDTRPAPDPRTFALVEELTGHAARGAAAGDAAGVAGDAGAGRTGEFQAMRREDLDSVLSPNPHGSELWSGARQHGAELDVVRKLPFGRAMARAAERHRVDPLLLAAIVENESAFAPDAVSSEGAIGLMQLIPETGELYGKTDLFDPVVNLEVGSQYIGALLDRYHGDLALALAAYNCGPATVTRYGAVPPFRETRDFVKGVLARYVEHRQSAWKRSKESTDLLSSRGGAGWEAEMLGRLEGGRRLLGRDRRSLLEVPLSRSSALLGR